MAAATTNMSSLPLEIMAARGEFARDPRFSSLLAPAPVERTAEPDPVAEAYARGFSEGAALARDEALHAERERDAARGAIELAFARFDEASGCGKRSMRCARKRCCRSRSTPKVWRRES